MPQPRVRTVSSVLMLLMRYSQRMMSGAAMKMMTNPWMMEMMSIGTPAMDCMRVAPLP